MTEPNLDDVLGDADRVAKSTNGATPRFAARDYEECMLALAESEKRAGESVGASLSRLHTDRDERLSKLARALYVAETIELRDARQREVAKLAALRERHAAESPIVKSTGPRAAIYDAMQTYTKALKRADESVEAAMGRLLLDGDAALAAMHQRYEQAA
ncbi:MAG: hypothetical protein DCC71_06780 [Proteobacteria bacterium]|nr:MAG: hypothetical protein DCC71_06780 [Pseudomonadota bacterium]